MTEHLRFKKISGLLTNVARCTGIRQGTRSYYKRSRGRSNSCSLSWATSDPPGTVQRSMCITSFSPNNSLQGKHYLTPQFTDDRGDLSHLPKITQLVAREPDLNPGSLILDPSSLTTLYFQDQVNALGCSTTGTEKNKGREEGEKADLEQKQPKLAGYLWPPLSSLGLFRSVPSRQHLVDPRCYHQPA